MWNARSRMAGSWSRTGQRLRGAQTERRPGVETLERRCLLSVSLPDGRGAVETITQEPVSAMTLTAEDDGYSRAEFDATGTYTGELRLKNRFEGSRTLALTLEIESQDEFGNVDGEFRGPTFGVATFRDGRFHDTKRGSRGWVHNLDMPWLEGTRNSDDFFWDGREGEFDGHFVPGNNDEIGGVLRDGRGRRLGNVTLTRTSVTDPPDPVNEAPVANADAFDTDVNEPLRLTQAAMLDNDDDPDGDDDRLSITAVSDATDGTVVINSDSTITFTPDTDFTGNATFNYTVSDGTDEDQGTVTITVNGNDPDAPVAGVDILGTDENTPLDIDQGTLLANDSDPTDDPISITAVGEATNGSVVLNGDGSITFTPATDFDGIASFSYTLSDESGLSDEGHVYVTVRDTDDDDDDDGGGDGTDDGTQPSGAFPAAGDPEFAVLEVNAEEGVTIGTVAVAEDILADYDVTGVAGDSADDDDADAIARYGVAQVNFGPDAVVSEQFRTTAEAGDDNFAIEALGVVDVEAGDSGEFTLGLRFTNGAGRLSVIRAADGTVENLIQGNTGESETEFRGTLDSVTLNDGDQLRVVFAEGNTPAGEESLQLFTLADTDLNGDGELNDEVLIGAPDSGITILAPATPPGPPDSDDDGENGGGAVGDGTDDDEDSVSSAAPVVGAKSLVGTYEGTLRLTAKSTDAKDTGRNRAIEISIGRHTVDGAIRGSVEVYGLLFDANGDGIIDASDDADADGSGDLNFTGFVRDDRFALALEGPGGQGGGVVTGTVRPDHHLFGELFFQAGEVFADGNFDAIRVSTTPSDPSPPLVDPPPPGDPGAVDDPNTPGGGGLPGGGGDPDAEPAEPDVIIVEEEEDDGDDATGDGGDDDSAGDPLVGPGNPDDVPGAGIGGSGDDAEISTAGGNRVIRFGSGGLTSPFSDRLIDDVLE